MGSWLAQNPAQWRLQQQVQQQAPPPLLTGWRMCRVTPPLSKAFACLKKRRYSTRTALDDIAAGNYWQLGAAPASAATTAAATAAATAGLHPQQPSLRLAVPEFEPTLFVGFWVPEGFAAAVFGRVCAQSRSRLADLRM